MVHPAAEAAIFGWVSALPFPLGVALASGVKDPPRYRRHVAWLLAFSSGAVAASLLIEVFATSVMTFLARAREEAQLAAQHPRQAGAPVQQLAAESGGHTPLDDETAHCAKVCIILACLFAPVGAWAYVTAHQRCLQRMTWAKTDDERLAVAVILGQVVDGVPEAAMIGVFTLRHELSLVLLLSIALGNIPEAVSVTLLGALPVSTVWLVWTGLFLATGVLSGVTAMIFVQAEPTMQGQVYDDYAFATLEGLASGAMLVVVAGQYLPDAARHLAVSESDARAGIPLVLGVVSAVLVKTLGGQVALHEDLPNLTTHTESLNSWGVGGAVMPEALLDIAF